MGQVKHHIPKPGQTWYGMQVGGVDISVSILNVLCDKLTYCAYKKKTNDPAHGKLYLSQRQTVKVMMRMCICVVSSVSFSLVFFGAVFASKGYPFKNIFVHKSMNAIVCKHLGLLNHFKVTCPRTLLYDD